VSIAFVFVLVVEEVPRTTTRTRNH